MGSFTVHNPRDSSAPPKSPPPISTSLIASIHASSQPDRTLHPARGNLQRLQPNTPYEPCKSRSGSPRSSNPYPPTALLPPPAPAPSPAPGLPRCVRVTAPLVAAQRPDTPPDIRRPGGQRRAVAHVPVARGRQLVDSARNAQTGRRRDGRPRRPRAEAALLTANAFWNVGPCERCGRSPRGPRFSPALRGCDGRHAPVGT